MRMEATAVLFVNRAIHAAQAVTMRICDDLSFKNAQTGGVCVPFSASVFLLALLARGSSGDASCIPPSSERWYMRHQTAFSFVGTLRCALLPLFSLYMD